MKKLMCLALGLTLFGTAFQPLTQASRDAYHAYLISQDVKRASFGRTVRATADKVEVENQKPKKYATAQMSARSYRNSRAAMQSYYVKAAQDHSNTVNRPTRTFTTTTRAPWKPERMPRITNVSAKLAQVDYTTHLNDAFSLKLPAGYQESREQDHHFTYDRQYEIRIKSFEKDTCPDSFGFTQCGINISKNENYRAVEGQGRLAIVDKVIRQSNQKDTVLNDLALQTDTYTERFSAYFLDGEIYTVSRYFVRNQDGKIYLVETKVPQKQAAKYVGIDKTVFDSFRIYPETTIDF